MSYRRDAPSKLKAIDFIGVDKLTNYLHRVPGGLASWITWKKPEPLAPLEMTIEAPGRIATDGEVIRKFNAELFTERLQSLVVQKPDAITVSLMNSFANTIQ